MSHFPNWSLSKLITYRLPSFYFGIKKQSDLSGWSGTYANNLEVTMRTNSDGSVRWNNCVEFKIFYPGSVLDKFETRWNVKRWKIHGMVFLDNVPSAAPAIISDILEPPYISWCSRKHSERQLECVKFGQFETLPHSSSSSRDKDDRYYQMLTLHNNNVIRMRKTVKYWRDFPFVKIFLWTDVLGSITVSGIPVTKLG